MQSGIDPEANFDAIASAAQEAANDGAEILFTPEMSILLDQDRERAARWIDSDRPTEMQARLGRLAEEVGLALSIGSMPVPSGRGKWANRGLYFDADGEQIAHYDKMHLFDVELSSGESWRESNAYDGGREVVTVEDTPVGRLGLTICYDLRFPALFDALGRCRCDCLATPAAFTQHTGPAHWHVLQRARAIEATAFVVAAAQVGVHEDGRKTYGHSLVVDPWGEIMLDMRGEGPALGVCELDLKKIHEVREQIPSLANKAEI